MSFAEDLAPFFAEFAVEATLDGAAVQGIFDAPGGVQTGAGSSIVATEPLFTLRTAQVPAAVFGKPMVIGGANYTVREHLPDGTGVSTLALQAA